MREPALISEYAGVALLMALFSGVVFGAGAAAMLFGPLACTGGW